MIDVCVNQVEENMALVWIYLKLSDNTVYKFPFSDSRKVYIANENVFSSSGLQIKCISPLRKWRISFNGVLEKCNTGSNIGELIHTRFSFLWLAMSNPQEQNFSYSKEDLAQAFTRTNHRLRERDLKWLHELQNRYDQWGQMMGTITFKNETEKELYFWSLRTRIADFPNWEEDLKCAKFYMYFMDGIPLKVECLSVKQFLSNLNSGFTVSPFGGVKPVSNCSFNINRYEENQKELKFSCVLNGKSKTIKIRFIDGESAVNTGPESQMLCRIRPFKVQMDDHEDGFGILHYTNISRDGRRERKDFKSPPILLKDPGFSSCEKSVLLLEDVQCRSSIIAGGKGSSLALLTQLSEKTKEFSVPKGFVITTKAFADHLKLNSDVSDAVERLKNVSCKILDGDLKMECSKCREVFVSTKLSDHLKNDIQQILTNAYDSMENVRFSVRSSAFGEDSEDLSAAGQMLTILGVRDINNVFKAVVECWASKFSFEAVQYSRQNGQSLLSPMAVVIQEMVPSDFSGVMFTVDPVTGDPTYPYITANFGLGETVVSALADPDTVVLERKQDTLTVFKVEIGSKMTQVFMTAENGTEQRKLKNQLENSCLTNEWALKIGNAGILIESCFCSARDIEWAVYKDKLYLLQARPITTLHSETDFELIHDQDTPVRSVHEFWTRANTGEIFLGATSPLGISLVVAGMDIYGHNRSISREATVNDFCPYFFHLLPVTHRHVAINLIDMLFKSNSKEITPLQKAFEIALFGRPVITETIHRTGIKKFGYASTKKKYMTMFFIQMLSYRMPKAVDKLAKEIAQYKVPLEKFTSAKETWDGILGQMNFSSQAFNIHGMTTFLSSFYNMMLLTILAKGKKEYDAELYCDFSTLLSSCSGVESADVPESLQELAKTVAQNHGSKFASIPASEAYDILKNDPSDSGEMFRKFIERHGHRCIKEFDVYSKSWGMQPDSLIPMLQNMVKAPNILNSSTKEPLSTESTIAMIKTPLSAFNKKLLKMFLSRSRKYVCEREKTKSLLIKDVDWLRKSCYQLGDQMVHEGLLPDAELVFFLTAEEIKDILEFQKPGLISKAVRRKRLHLTLNELKFPEIMEGIPKPIQTQTDHSNYASSFTLRGTPVCQGTVKGKAVVVLTLDEASKIESGDILITHATDTGWSPYFPLLSGVVTVLGGLISHGAVVAREFGLPCIVGVENATEAFKSGDTVILNGTEGSITKILEELKE